MPTDINEARSAFENGVDRSAARDWQNNAEDASGDYEDEFEGILQDQNNCAQETEESAGYERLMAYAECIGE
jgi:hypothetical protein